MLTDEQVEHLISELQKKIELDRGVTCPNLKEVQRDTRGGETYPQRIIADSDPISGKGLGNFKHIIKYYVVSVTIWLESESSKSFTAYPNFYYTHTSGGKNGYNLDFRIKGKIGNDWTKFKIEVIQPN